MKFSYKIFVLSLFTISTIISGTLISSFIATSNGDTITLNWETSFEDNIKGFEILRGKDKDNLAPIATVDAKGNNSQYSYVDQNAYKTSSSFYAYGLVLIDNFGNKSGVVMHTQVVHDNVSSVKRTWGSIKALFR